MDIALFPLADRLRPEKLEDFQGQEHLIGPQKIVRTLVETRNLTSIIFWGPPGTGKTTLARIIVKETGYPSMEFSATISGIADIKAVMEKTQALRQVHQKPLVLFVDEIHHFNRHAQDAFLAYVERGDILLLGSTTENPAFKINRALLSRMKILELYPLQHEDLERIFHRAQDYLQEQTGKAMAFSPSALQMLLEHSGGDARRMLNVMEMVTQRMGKAEVVDEKTLADILQKRVSGYDRSGDDRYELISALHKSIRNSDVDASLFWLYRMIEGGEDPLYIIRRMIRMAVEDIGLADPEALKICLWVKDAYQFLGSPEGDLFLAEAAVYLATAPKSNALYEADGRMKKLTLHYKDVPVPLQILNPSHFIAAAKGAGREYQYAHDFSVKTTVMETLPPEVKERDFYIPQTLGFEKEIRKRLEYWRKKKERLRKEGKEGEEE